MIPTTFEMDGLLTDDDIANRFMIHRQCRDCGKWTKMDTRDKNVKCRECGGDDFDLQSTTSDRTFNPLTKRKVR